MKKPKRLASAMGVYEVEGEIGQGGAGHVYRVRDESGIEFAAKVLTPGASRVKRARFMNEIGFCKRADHPNIVSVVADGGYESEEGLAPFYVMKLFPGSLRRAMAARLSPTEAFACLVGIVHGLEYAHTMKVVHRDLKPENILYESGQPVIADFGVAHFEEDVLTEAIKTRDADRLANFCYASPEQRTGAPGDERSDIYSFGLIANELFTGQVAAGTSYKRIRDSAVAFAFLDDIIDEMLRQAPAERPQSVARVRARIEVAAEQAKAAAFRQAAAAPAPVMDETDPLMQSDVEVADADIVGVKLVIKLTMPPNRRWISILNQGYDVGTNDMNYPHSSFDFRGDTASVHLHFFKDSDRILQLFKEWLKNMGRLYRKAVNEERAREAETKRGAEIRFAQEEAERAAARAKLRNVLRS